MALKFADRTAESTVTVGTGDIMLAGAITADHDTFATQFADGDNMPVAVFGGGKWMTFEGRYNSGANSITVINFRDSSTGAPISLSGTMTVMCGFGAADARAALRTDADQALNSAAQLQALTNVGLSPPQSGRLTYVSTTSITFLPYNGDLIKIAGVIYRIPTTGIAGLANTSVFVNGVGGANLATNTRYYVYAFVNAGVVTADFSTTGHSASSAAGNVGTEIKTGDDSRTLIGMIRTTGALFSDGLTLSWFNRREKVSTASNQGASTGSSSLVNIAGNVAPFLTWGDEAAQIVCSGEGATSISATFNVSLMIDGSLVGQTGGQAVPSTNFKQNISCQHIAVLAEGYHDVRLAGSTNGGVLTASFMLYAKTRG